MGHNAAGDNRHLVGKIENKEAVVGIMGLGYVGLPLAASFASTGFRVLGTDISEERVRKVNRGESYIGDVDSKELAALTAQGLVRATSDFRTLVDCDIINICVPTPFTPSKEPDVSYIVASSEEISKRLRKEQLIVLKSTTFPETTEKIVLPILQKSGLTVGRDFYLAYSPERIDPGNEQFTAKSTPVVVGGVTSECTRLAALFYSKVTDHVHSVSSTRAAEMAKLLENIFRSVNIALVNELARLCDRMGNVDVWEVIEAASTKPFGFMPFYPGPGIGGHCIPVDPYYLSWKARQYDFHTNFIELAAETNDEMPYFVVNMVIEAISRGGVCPSEASVLILGIAFKEDVGDLRNSPALKVMEILRKKVASVKYNDPHLSEITLGGERHHSIDLKEGIKKADCVVITAAHSLYDYPWIVENARTVVDTRNAAKGIASGKIIRLGA
jgi:UDP-N-acetyl-D-glucosamine dehydrogenase